MQQLLDELIRCSPWDRMEDLRVHAAHAPYRALDPRSLLQDHLPDTPLVVVRSALQVRLQEFPNAGKFLQALSRSAWHPKSPNFNPRYKAEMADAVGLEEARELIRDALLDYPAASGDRFIRTFGYLSSEMDQSNILDVELLQNFDPGLKTFRHAVGMHWLDIAREAASRRLSQCPPPICLFEKPRDAMMPTKLEVIGHLFPSTFGLNLQNSLTLNGWIPQVSRKVAVSLLLSMDLDADREELEAEIPYWIPEDEIVRLVHVQLRLTCLGIAEVQGALHEESVQFLAKLLGYSFSVLNVAGGAGDFIERLLQEVAHLKSMHLKRGIMLLVLGLTQCDWQLSGLTSAVGVPLRLVLCYD